MEVLFAELGDRDAIAGVAEYARARALPDDRCAVRPITGENRLLFTVVDLTVKGVLEAGC